MKKLVSCIIPTYNRANLLATAIESILRQTYGHWELVIVDDQSTDDTRELVAQYAARDARVKYYLNPGKGQSVARNYGLRVAQGDLIAFLDDDDISLPHRFEVQVSAMAKNNCAFLVSGYEVRDRATDAPIAGSRKMDQYFRKASFPSRWMMEKRLFDLVGGFEEDYPCMTDAEFSYRLSEYETYAIQKEIVTIMYHTPESTSRVLPKRVLGRQLLLERNENKMDPLEAGWWYFTTGIDYYNLGEQEKAREQFRRAAERDKRGVYRLAYRLYNLTHFKGGIFKRIHMKILLILRDFQFMPVPNRLIID